MKMYIEFSVKYHNKNCIDAETYSYGFFLLIYTHNLSIFKITNDKAFRKPLTG